MSARVPEPPVGKTKMKTAALHVQYPSRSTMDGPAQQWVQQVRNLAEEATAAVGNAQIERAIAQQSRRNINMDLHDKVAGVHSETKRKIDDLLALMKKITTQLSKHEVEMTELLKVREKAVEKLNSVKKPLNDLQRRLVHRGQNVPDAEAVNNTVEVDLRSAAMDMNVSVDSVFLLIQAVERHAAHMSDIRDAMRLDLVDRQKALDLADVSSGNLTKPPSNGSGSSSLPPLTSPRALKWNKDSGSMTVPSPPRNASGSQKQPQPPAARSYPQVIKSDSKRCLEMSATSISESAMLRTRVHTATKALNQCIAKNTASVEASIKRQVDDTKALRAILSDRLALTKSELEQVDSEIRKLSTEAYRLNEPLQTANNKLQYRRINGKGTRDAEQHDPLAIASGREMDAIRLGQSEHQRHLGALLQQKGRLAALAHQLTEALESKTKLMNLDLRVLQIGHTPGPPSRMSATPCGSERSLSTSGRRQLRESLNL